MALSRLLPALLAALIFCFPGAVRAEQGITWITHPMPPAFISDGPDAGAGVGDLQLRFLMQHLGRYDHRVLRSSFARMWTQMAREDGVCAQSVFLSPERRKVAVFTRRALREVGYRLYARPDAAKRFTPYLTAAGEVDFSRLARETDMHGAYFGTRLLPEPVAGPLESAEARTDLQQAQSTRQLLQMLAAGRLDFFLAVGNEVAFYHRGDLASFPLKDVAPFNDVYIACSDKPLGRAVIAQIDSLQAQDAQWAEFVAPMRRWHTAAEIEESLASKPRAAAP